MLKEIPFFGKNHKDMYKHIDEVLDIANYFNTPIVTKDTMMIRMLPITLKDTTMDWLKSLPPGAITIWAKF